MKHELIALFADDAGHQESDSVTDGLSSALLEIDPRLGLKTPMECIDTLSGVKQRLRDETARLDLVVIDVNWRTMGGSNTDSAEGLLKLALARQDLAAILASGGDGSLISYLYDPRKASVRPHAVIHKDMFNSEGLVAGVLLSAFSQARMPIRSLVVQIEWDLSQAPMGKVPDVDPVVVSEITCAAASQSDRIELQPIGGGLSGALTILARSTSRSPAGSKSVREYMFKMEQDWTRLRAELWAHRELVDRLPTGTFAPLVDPQPLLFGGWGALVFAQAAGETASSVGEKIVTTDIWDRIFPLALIRRLVDQAQLTNLPISTLMTGEHGQLKGDRMQRAQKELAKLQLDGPCLSFLSQDVDQLFDLGSRTTALTLLHSDLHTRNVLVDQNGSVAWVDAASMVEAGFWLADVARFAVWLASEQMAISPLSGPQLASALALTSRTSRMPGWAAALRKKISGSLEMYAGAWKSRGWAIDVEQDWRAACSAELLRISYSSASFESKVRNIAANAAYTSLQAEVP